MAKTARKRAAPRERKTARMEMRIPPSAKDLIRRAMLLSGRSAADLAYEGAKRVLDEHERMILAGRNRDVFLAAVRQQPPPAPRLITALLRHNRG